MTATRESDQSRLQWLLVQAARVVLSGGNGGVRDTSIIWFLVDCDLRSIFISTIIWLWRQGVTSLSKVAFSRSWAASAHCSSICFWRPESIGMSWFSGALSLAPGAVGVEDSPSSTSSIWTSGMARCWSECRAPPVVVDRADYGGDTGIVPPWWGHCDFGVDFLRRKGFWNWEKFELYSELLLKAPKYIS